MAQRSYSPYPSVDSASDYSPEPLVPSPPKRRARGSMTAEERREARAHRNRLAAQSSRDRKKVQFELLRDRVSQLEEENRALRMDTTSLLSPKSALDASLARENAELRSRVQQLEQAWQNMVKILGTMAIPVPSTMNVDMNKSTPHSSLKSPILSLPLSPAPTTSSESIDVMSESTRELARFANISIEMSLQRVAPSARSSVLRLLSEQNNWERPRCTTLQPSLPSITTNGPPVLCF
ncbi:hypothetical protein FRC14_005700 [Serendipita sp. 396]|nr:hypothetical protein FRC14_005700 [Serendipita sp. 396]KAG8780073.1 hypothetical protein FRC15_009759 [Serendipita sp. 397]KAG8801246.1 hypothetical protein FRC16_000966 [Serendipita sp. 398]KAG8826231.1 hypothetical protein FRC19_009464 [Serendipita sp. 401]KAG8837932.1 hypothetical protein FRC18_007275 [Serendipita sp. 400]KAG8858096.1 hypothetical protein FRB91_010399 [Serendipita sp. 411]KAG8865654.1 hypothetical protein FRC20_009614 [Serendipita sp. 405]KAG9056952.1 hypothetical prot